MDQLGTAPLFLGREIGDAEGEDEQPVPVAHDRVPDSDARRRLQFFHVRHSQSSALAISRGPAESALI